MRIKSWALCCVALVGLIFVCVALACSGGNGTENSRTSLIQEVPKEDTSSLLTIDVRAFREDRDLTSAYESWKQSYKGRLDQVGVDPDEVETCADLQHTFMLTGQFDANEIQSTLKSNGYSQSQFDPETVMWTGGHLGNVFVDKGIVVVGEHVEECIHVMKYDAESLGDIGDVTDVVDRVGGGLITVVMNWPLHEGMKAAAYSVQKTGKDICQVTIVYKFDDEVDPQDSLDAVEHHELRRVALRNVDIEQDGQYITLTGDVNVNDLFVPWGNCDMIPPEGRY